MKHTLKYTLFAAMLVFAMASCKKDTSNQPKLNISGATATLSANATGPFVLDSTQNATTAVTFSWDSVKFGYSPNGTVYVLQFDVPSDSFKTPQTISVTGYTQAVTVLALNNMANQLSMVDGAVGTLNVRLKVTVTQLGVTVGTSEIVAPVYSNIISLQVNPYYVAIPFSYLWVVGDYMNWTWPPSGVNLADSLASVKSNGKYEGFVKIIGGTSSDQFKLCPAFSWNEAFANASSSVSTTGFVTTIPLNTAGGTNNNLSVPANGIYYMQADTLALTLSATQVNSISVIGSATGNTAVPLTYDTVANHWSASSSLSSGSIKFVVNNGDPSSVSFGASNLVNHVANGGAPISVATAGTYNIILNVSHPGSYTDSLQ